jgi:omega-amidase
MRIALISLDQRWLDKDANFARCGEILRSAAAQGCTVAIFPEMTLTGYSLDMETTAEPAQDSPSLRRLESMARETGVNVIFGASLVEPGSGNPLNTLCLARAGGGVEAVYAKIHPFSFAGEDLALQAGARLGAVTLGELELGCSICYDLRFPEMYSAMARSCNAVVNIANWPIKRVGHWRALLVARAIENQYFVFGVNRTGADGNGLQYEKSSMVVSPEGNVLAALHSEQELDVYDVDLGVVSAYRKAFPTVSDKRYALYKEFY